MSATRNFNLYVSAQTAALLRCAAENEGLATSDELAETLILAGLKAKYPHLEIVAARDAQRRKANRAAMLADLKAVPTNETEKQNEI